MSSAQVELLLSWYSASARALPWRRTRDPYAIWISEIMLQQTQVKTVLPRYAEWFVRFPDISSLAMADLDVVLKAWEGLGYYRRARLLHQAAHQIVGRHYGLFPTTFDDILELPGVGRSTAGAIASICFGAPAPVLDGNVKRVLKRWSGKTEAEDRELWTFAQQAVDHAGDPASWNQAMMELGATVCDARKPDCATCPVSRHCDSAFQSMEQSRGKKQAPVVDVHWRVSLHLDQEKGIWLTQRPASGIWAKLWSPPIIELTEKPDRVPCHIHRLTHRRLHLYSDILVGLPSGNGLWVKDVSQLALPTGIRRLLGQVACCKEMV